MAGVRNTTVNSDVFVDDVKTAIKAIKESKKRADTKAIWQHLSNKLASKLASLLEHLNTITNSLYKSSDENIDKSYECGHSRGDEFKMPKNTVTIDCHYRNKFAEKEIPTSYNKFDCLNIGKDVVITNDVKDNGLINNKKLDQGGYI